MRGVALEQADCNRGQDWGEEGEMMGRSGTGTSGARLGALG